MTEFSTLLAQGNAWLFVPSAILLGILHGLEPGHSKTMMAAFIIAVRGTIGQAILLGLAATLSHTAIVWLIALGGMYFGQRWSAETSEPYLQLASAVLIIGVALWMIWQTWRNQKLAGIGHSHDHDHDHDHSHGHVHDEVKIIDTIHGVVRLEVDETAGFPLFRLYPDTQNPYSWGANDVYIETERSNGRIDIFTFVTRDGVIQSEQEIPEPHEFVARLRLTHKGQYHNYQVEFSEHHHHAVGEFAAVDITAPGYPHGNQDGYQDAHELAHANDIRRRFTNRKVTTGQIAIFGLTGGLIPCPASITVLLICLQLKKIALGATLVLCFSIGLAVTLVLSGVIAALSVKHAAKRWNGFGELARKAPYISGGLILLVGLYLGYQGVRGILTL